MSAEPISLQEWLNHATPNNPLEILRAEARKLAQDATDFERLLAVRADVAEFEARFGPNLDWDKHFEETNERHQYASDEEEEDWAA